MCISLLVNYVKYSYFVFLIWLEFSLITLQIWNADFHADLQLFFEFSTTFLTSCSVPHAAVGRQCVWEGLETVDPIVGR